MLKFSLSTKKLVTGTELFFNFQYFLYIALEAAYFEFKYPNLHTICSLEIWTEPPSLGFKPKTFGCTEHWATLPPPPFSTECVFGTSTEVFCLFVASALSNFVLLTFSNLRIKVFFKNLCLISHHKCINNVW